MKIFWTKKTKLRKFYYFLGFKIGSSKNMEGIISEQINQTVQNILPAIGNLSFDIKQEMKSRVDINREISKCLSVYNLHQKVFPQFKNINQGKDVVLVATGPTLKDYEPIKDAVHIGVNKAFKFDKVKFDYLITQDFSANKNYIDDFCNYDAIKFLGILSLVCPQCIIPESIAEKYNINRFYTAHPDELPFPPLDISSSIFWDAYSVVFPTMQFILWTNPKKIYLVGCDCSEGYFDNTQTDFPANHLIDGWKKLKEFASIYYPETEIISINPVGLKGVFKDIYQNPKD